MELTAAETAAACGGRLIAGDPAQRFTAAAIDSRRAGAGALFVALPGNRVDGHDYVLAAMKKGAAGALVTRNVEGAPGVLIEVDDTTRALQALASHWRTRIGALVIGVAGSNGKTTTKDTLGCVLGEEGQTFATPGNENSQVGAPVALLSIPSEAEYAVLELGTSAPGELTRLAEMAQPGHAIVTAAFAEHLEWLGDIDGVIAAETEILDSLPAKGLALVGSAEPKLVDAARKRSHVQVRSIGLRADDDWRLEDVRPGRDGTRFTLVRTRDGSERERHAWRIPLLGAPAAWAGAFAVAMARELGLEPDAIQRGLDRAQPANHRLVAIEHSDRPLLVLDDCYNSNPASCLAAVDAALSLARDGERLILVIGDMLELGDASEEAHREVGREIARRAPRAQLITVGPSARLSAESARAAGASVEAVDDADAAISVVNDRLRDRAPTTLLAKASRGIGLDRLVAALAEAV